MLNQPHADDLRRVLCGIKGITSAMSFLNEQGEPAGMERTISELLLAQQELLNSASLLVERLAHPEVA
jgi:hypothetical protein